MVGADSGRKLVALLQPDGITADLDATYDYVNALPAVARGQVGTIGFCWGGGQSFRYATSNPRLKAVVVCYGVAPDWARLPRIAAPVLLTHLPATGVGRVAPLLADQPALAVRRDRFTADSDFVSGAFDERLLRDLNLADLAFLQRRYARPLERSGLREGARVVDWLPWLDARVLPALKRALPGLRIVIVQRDLRDALLNWLAFGASAKLPLPDPVAGARWLKRAAAHLEAAADLLPLQAVDADSLLSAPDGDEGRALAAFLGLERLTAGPLAQAAERNKRGMPVDFASGHAENYRDALAEAFAALD